ncbi:DUF4214 domain-containing protein [Thiospirillum jenense]|uniref:DUF4214 domain-containing protein n=1 Tax=Thiospirillum jenense TaxID=1653858 RepID=A0A839HFK2_9GAMM|nr:DUF4214 domain-containing protein [Thiospirillum jenense]MBB1126136.1 DUF4214 domain-containing protein [Thiospirillum jenense]
MFYAKLSLFAWLLFNLQFSHAGCSGCCSSHEGIGEGCAENDRIYCGDGSISPSCPCECRDTDTTTIVNTIIDNSVNDNSTSLGAAIVETDAIEDDTAVAPREYTIQYGKVTAVTDGDTIKITALDGSTYTIRLAEIDAPESCQRFGFDAKQSLTDLLLNKYVTVMEEDIDRYGRVVAHITGDFFIGSASEYQLEHGLAWVYDDYATDSSLDVLEQIAHDAQLGLWADNTPMPPWEWRRGEYDCVSQRDSFAWQVAELYVATLGYAPDNEGLQYWIDELQNGNWTQATVAQSFFDNPTVQAMYPSNDNSALIDALYLNIFNRFADTEGHAYWLTELDSGNIQRNQMVIALLNGCWTNPDAADDLKRFQLQVEVALAFAGYQDRNGIVFRALHADDQLLLRQAGTDVLESITTDTDTKYSAIDAIPALLGGLID